MTSESNVSLWAFVIFAAVVFFIAAVMIGLSYVLGERHQARAMTKPYEGGIPPTGSARIRFSSSFYLIAMFFVIFDLDTAFIIIWSVSFRELGVPGFIGIAIFILVLLILFLYELRTGALDFGPKGKKILKQMEQYRARENNE
ncbi:MAG: NADH-quinone oxidoreductase subunit A [Bacteroidales bacterium]|nr:NADH-quinone oxidoreductase subunit A [Bacteroidales bacterium]